MFHHLGVVISSTTHELRYIAKLKDLTILHAKQVCLFIEEAIKEERRIQLETLSMCSKLFFAVIARNTGLAKQMPVLGFSRIKSVTLCCWL